MKHIEIDDLPNRIGNGEKYRVRRGDVELGYFLPVVKPESEHERPAAETVAVARHQATGSNGVNSAGADRGRLLVDDQLLQPALNSELVAEIMAQVTPRPVDLQDLLRQTDDKIRTGGSLAVERDGVMVGHLIPVKPKPDPEEMARLWDNLNRTIDAALRNGYTREQLAEDLDLSKPFREEI